MTIQTEAFRQLMQKRRERDKAEAVILRLDPEIRALEAQVQQEQGKCACWLPHGDPKCLCGVLGRRKVG